jgi:uncharacterized damage-inducible protein DinB
MAQQTLSERDGYLATFEREYETTRRVLHAYPADQAELKPADNLKTARELAWMLVLNQAVVRQVLDGRIDPQALPLKPPPSWNEVLEGLDREHEQTRARLQKTGEDDLNATIQMPVGPGRIGDLRSGDAMWMFLYDTIHHRGQLSVYHRIAGARLPSIYGPTADEPWT